MPDYDRLRFDELASISEFLHGLSDEQWDHESLCAGWRVRHVVSHMTLGYTTPMLTMMAKVGRHGFNVPKASAEESVEYGNGHTPPRSWPRSTRSRTTTCARHLEADPREGERARPRRAPAGHAPPARTPAHDPRRTTRGRARRRARARWLREVEAAGGRAALHCDGHHVDARRRPRGAGTGRGDPPRAGGSTGRARGAQRRRALDIAQPRRSMT